MKAVSAKRRKRDAVYNERRRQAYERADGACEALGPDCVGVAHDTHHIAGRLGEDPHRLSNLKVVCDPCHRTIHAYPEWAYARGHSVRRNGKDVA